VIAVLKSGLPFTPLTRSRHALYDFLKEKDVSVCSNKTYRNIAKDLTENALRSLHKTLRKQFLFITMDSTPAKDTRNFITSRLNYIDKNGIWNDAHFGVMVANGVVSSDDYEKHLELRMDAFDIQP